MTVIGTKFAGTNSVGPKAVGTKTWQLGSGSDRRGDGVRAKGSMRDEGKLDGKLLAKSKASLAESERMLSRQTILLAQLRADGFVTTEAEKSVARLEAALLAQRAAHDGLLAKAGLEGDATQGGPTSG